MSAVQITSWADLLRELDRALAFVRELRLEERLTDSRFAGFRQRIAKLTQILETEGAECSLRFTSRYRHGIGRRRRAKRFWKIAAGSLEIGFIGGVTSPTPAHPNNEMILG